MNRKIWEAERRFFNMSLGQQISCLVFLYLIAMVACASAQTGKTGPTVETILALMTQARTENRAHLRRYIVTRDYELFGKERQNAKSQVIADITFVPPNFKEYVIERTTGTGLGETIVRRMLESETEVAKDYRSTDISPDNYDFRLVREEDVSGQNCYVLELLPRRKAKNLLRGSIWVDAHTYLLRRADGGPAKLPSWWVKEVRIQLLYGAVGGMWLQTASEATAEVRILGQHTIITRDMKYDVSEPVATGSTVATSLLKQMPDKPLRQRIIKFYPSNTFVKNDDWNWNRSRTIGFARF